jgi:hypothetical protein
MKKKLSFAKDLITSTHLRFHAMVVSGQPKTQTQMRKKVLKNKSKIALKNF